MRACLDYKGNKGFRLLNIYERLNKGEVVEKKELAESFGVTLKTIQRDIDDLRAYILENHFEEVDIAIKYDKTKNGYYLMRLEREWLTNEDILVLCKILLESRALCKDELDMLISKLLKQVAPNNRSQLEHIIQNEQYYYVPVKHNKRLLSPIWDLSQYIVNSEIISFSYIRQDGVKKEHTVKPVAIMFSEYYFYLVGYLANGSKDFPTIFRIDRMEKLKGIQQSFEIPYRDRFNEGEFRKRVQFMYPGELKKIKFEFSGPSIEAIVDRLPTAEILKVENGVYTVQAEVYGNGIDMWIRSQGDFVQLI